MNLNDLMNSYNRIDIMCMLCGLKIIKILHSNHSIIIKHR